MPFAITLKAANDTASPIRTLWEQVSRFEDQPSMRALNYPPHITLAVYEHIDGDRLHSALTNAFAGMPALRLAFDGIRHFDGVPLVLWAEPSSSAHLARAHATIHAEIDPALCQLHYRPGTWVPHCTLGMRVSEKHRAEALAFADRFVDPFEVVFDTADWVSFPPVSVIQERALSLAYSD
jgi:2'-5' RNA ligase